MTKPEIIKYIAENKMVETITKNITGYIDDDYKDLIQDIYLVLYEKSEEMLQNLYKENKLNFYLARIIENNIYSSHSRFYYTYKKNKINRVSLDDVNTDKY